MKKTSRDIILQRLKVAKNFDWAVPNELPSPFIDQFPSPQEPLAHFKQALETVGGEVIIVSGNSGIISALQTLKTRMAWTEIATLDKKIEEIATSAGLSLTSLNSAEIVFTPCEFLISSSGSILVSSNTGPGRKAHVSPRVHVIFAQASQLQLFIRDAFEALKKKYDEMPSWIGLITGPSRTADIEKTLVMGAHGPNKLIVLIDDKL